MVFLNNVKLYHQVGEVARLGKRADSAELHHWQAACHLTALAWLFGALPLEVRAHNSVLCNTTALSLPKFT